MICTCKSRIGRATRPLVAVILLALTAAAGAAHAGGLRLAYVGPEDSNALLGARQGLDEANLQGRFLGMSYSLDIIAPEALGGFDPQPYMAVISAADRDTLLQLSELAPDRPVFNVVLDDDALREACKANVLHVFPSAAMKRDAIAQWQQKHAQSRVSAVAWHPDFVKFAARDLNKRFKEAFSTPMDSESWAGWAAVKMSTDAIARAKPADARSLLAHLRTSLSFDGQKGVDMTFRETGQLRQPLLLIEDGVLLGEAPVRGVADADDLDSLGPATCR
jgi:hypothetical protein